jgi:hypothetical protein
MPAGYARETAPAFDPSVYPAKLRYTDAVRDLGLTEEDAELLALASHWLGLHKGIAFALRWPTGEIAGFCSVTDGTVKLPKRLIPPKIVQLRCAQMSRRFYCQMLLLLAPRCEAA